MKIAYFSPLSPLKTGIATYSENNLLPYLKKYCEIEIFIDDNYKPSNKYIKKNFKVDSYKNFKYSNYDVVLYHLGNNPYHEYIYNTLIQYPGVVVIHDAFIGDLIAYLTFHKGKPESYVEHLVYCLGEKGRKIAENAISSGNRPTFNYPLIKKVADSSMALIVHNNFAKEKVSLEAPETIVKKINHPTPLLDVKSNGKKENFNIEKSTTVISTFGFVARHKRLGVVLKAFKRFIDLVPDSKFLIVGSFLEKNYREELNQLIRELKLSDNVIFDTGYIEDLIPYIQISDIVIQTRYPTAGETSGMTLEIMRIGKPVVVSNTGWFKELPDEVSIKIDINEDEEKSIINAFTKLVKDKSFNEKLGSKAKEYVKNEHDPEKIAYEIINFLSHMSSKEGAKYIQNFSAQLHELEINHNDSLYINHLSKIFHEVLS